MTRRLVKHWVTLHRDLGLNPHHCGSWTLDEAITAELYADESALAARVAAARARAR